MNEDLVRCPYNFSHMILKPRMAAHLIKCRMRHSTVDYSICPFNATHDVPTPELQYHTEICEDRKKLDSFIYVLDEAKPQDLNRFEIRLPPSTENWDEENTSSSYLDFKDEVIQNKPVFRIPVGMSKAERKAFFNQEVERFEKVVGFKDNIKCSQSKSVSVNTNKEKELCNEKENDSVHVSGGVYSSHIKSIDKL